MKFRGWSTRQNKHAPGQLYSFEDLSEEEIDAHTGIDWYDNFKLTDAIRPSWDVTVKPVEGFQHHSTFNKYLQKDVPVITASITRKKLWDLFLNLAEPFSDMVDIDIEHATENRDITVWTKYTGEDIETITLPSVLNEYEDFLVNDGVTKITIIDQNTESSIQLDDHKFLILTGAEYETRFREVLQEAGVSERRDMQFIDDEEHIHYEHPDSQELQELLLRISAEKEDENDAFFP